MDEIKNPGTEKAFEKSRLVVQAYNDADKTFVLTESPTILHNPFLALTCSYHSSMADDLCDIRPSDVKFLRKLKESKNSVVFKVAVNGKPCVMKVVSGLYRQAERR